jgi:hypothetical protein
MLARMIRRDRHSVAARRTTPHRLYTPDKQPVKVLTRPDAVTRFLPVPETRVIRGEAFAPCFVAVTLCIQCLNQKWLLH